MLSSSIFRGIYVPVAWLCFAAAMPPDAKGDSAAVADVAADRGEAWKSTLIIPVVDGTYDLGIVMGYLAEGLGLDGDAVSAKIEWKVKSNGIAANLPLVALQSATKGAVSFDKAPERLTMHVDRIKLRRQRDELQPALRSVLRQFFPDAESSAKARYGLFYHTDKLRRHKISDAWKPAGTSVVVLVHGLDEPGYIWRDLIPALKSAKFDVLEFIYPNDQAVENSTDALSTALQELAHRDVKETFLVAHSMGGLVSRNFLTDPKKYAGEKRKTYPRVRRLIMVGTPNYGSDMVRFRVLSEARDHMSRLLSGEGLVFGAFFDGSGEAGVDLLPGSAFLKTLNARPHPKDVQMTTVAGRASPVDRKTVEMLTEPAAIKKILGGRSELSETLKSSLLSLIDGIGDGAVPLSSAKLKGVEDTVEVDGNHISMLRIFPGLGVDVPPAVTVILNRLKIDRDDGDDDEEGGGAGQ